jgi:hypothetical protein
MPQHDTDLLQPGQVVEVALYGKRSHGLVLPLFLPAAKITEHF